MGIQKKIIAVILAFSMIASGFLPGLKPLVTHASGSKLPLTESMLTASSTKSGYALGNVIDGKTSTGYPWAINGYGAGWIKIDLGVETTINGWGVFDVGGDKNFALEKSSDGTNFTAIDSVTNNTATIYEKNFSTTYTARYFRFNVTATRDSSTRAMLGEIWLYGWDVTPPTLTAGAVSRTSETTGTVQFTSNEAGTYYYGVVEAGAAQPNIDTTGAGTACTTSATTITNPTGLTAGAKDIYIKVKDAANNVSDALKIEIANFILPAKVLTADTTNNDIFHDIEITFASDAAFEAAITGVSFKGTALTENTDYSIDSGKITLKPGGGNSILNTPATGNVVVTATGYQDSSVSQTIFAHADDAPTTTWQDSDFVGMGFGGGSGTSADPYKISNAAQLAYLAKQANHVTSYYGTYFVLVNDIDLSAHLWIPIGAGGFRGHFNGQGHTISGMTIRGGNNQGLFGVIGSDGYVERVAVINPDIIVTGSDTGIIGTDVGGIAAINMGTIENCLVRGTKTISGGWHVGGIAGSNYWGTIRHCVVDNPVSCSYNYVGGIAGSNDVSGGGYIDAKTSSDVIDCLSLQSASGPNTYGAIVGKYGQYTGTDREASVSNCHYINNGAGTVYAVGDTTADADNNSYLDNYAGNFNSWEYDDGFFRKDTYWSDPWDIGEDDSAVWTTDGGSKPIYLRPVTYTVTWKSQDGWTTLETDTGVHSGATPSYDGEAPTKDSDDRYDYTFVGWATSANSSYNTTLYAVTGNVTYYAVFGAMARTYKIIYDANGGTVSSASTSITRVSQFLLVPTRTGYVFGGWYDGTGDTANMVTNGAGILYQWGAEIPGYTVKYSDGSVYWSLASDKTVYAHWTASTCTIYLSPTGGTVSQPSTNVIYDSTTSLPIPTRAGYTFGGWYDGYDTTNTNGTGNRVTDNTGVPTGTVTGYVADGKWSLTANKRVYAKWTVPNVTPVFVGSSTALSVSQNTSATDIKGLLHVSDSDPGQTLTWSEDTVPSHGTLSFSGATASSGSTDITPGGTITYIPTAGYTGSDSFTVQVSDGTATATRTITVTVNDVTPPTLTAGAVNRTSDTMGTVKFTSDKAGQYYYAIVDQGAEAPVVDTSGAGIDCTTSETTITDPVGLTAGAKDIYIKVKDAAGNVSDALKIDIPAYVPIPLTVTGITALDKPYDGTTGAALSGFNIALSGVHEGDTVQLITSGAVGTFSDANVGANKDVFVTGLILTGADASKYKLSAYSTKAAITPKAITVTADAKSKIYGEADPALTYQASGLVGSDALSGSLARVPGENVGQYNITQGTLANSNYTITFVSDKLTIALKSITVTANAKSKVYGDTDPALTYKADGLLGNDTLNGVLKRADGETAGTYTINQGTLAAGVNYAITFVPADFTIVPKAITVTADAKSKVYGDTDPALTYTATGLVGSDTLSGMLARDTGENTGEYNITQGTLENSNYVITFVPAKLTVTARPVTVTADAKSKVYGETDPALTYQAIGLVGSDALGGALTRAAGENVGEYQITQGTLANSNYEITFVPAKLNITPKTITVTANAKSKVYGEADPALTYQASGLVGSDDLSGSLARVGGENVGQYNITQGTLVNSNYTITFVSDKLTIALKAITVTADTKSKVYGGTDPALTYKADGLLGNDTLNGVLKRADGETAGTYTINQGTLAAGVNYAITFVPADFTIVPKAITVTADAKSKVYGDTDPALTYTATGLVGSDTLSGMLARDTGENTGEYNITQGTLGNSNYVITFVPAKLTVTARPVTVTADAKSKVYGDTDPTLTYQATGLVGSDALSGALTRAAGENVGEYQITQGTLANSNYAISFVPAELNITPKTITVTANAKSKVYGEADPALTYQASGLVGSDTLSGTLARVAGENVGQYSITQGTLANSNYTITFVSDKLTIALKAVTVTADTKSKVYGDTDPTLTYQVTGLVGGDTLTGVLSRDASENVGQYDITQGTLSANGNYSLNYISAKLAINQKAITVTADAKSKIYGETDPALTYTAAGLVGSDTLSGILARNTGENVGQYDITQGTLGNTNYKITYSLAKLTISKKALTITSDVKSKIYGDANPALTVSYSGFVSGETEAVLTTKPTAATSATTATGIGDYDITASGAVSGNYDFTYVPAKLTVQKRTVTVKSEDKKKTNGDADPALTYQITSGNLVNNDTFTGALKRVSGENLTSVSQVYDIEQGTLALSGNYALTYAKGIFTIVPSTKCIISLVNTPTDAMFSGNSITKTVAYTVEQENINLTISDFATWKLYSDEACTQEITDKIFKLNVGDNTAYIKVMAQDASTNTVYTLSIHRKSNNTNLSTLSLSNGELSPVFDKNTAGYTSIIKGNIDSIIATATVEDTGKATITVNGRPITSATASQAIAMALGSGNTVTVVVTAEDTEYTKAYTVGVTKLSSNNNLASLITKEGTLSPEFDKKTLDYTMAVGSTVSQINMKPVVEDTGKATVKINGFELSNVLKSLPISLNPGINVVKIMVIAEDGTPKTYTLTVTRTLPVNVKGSNANLIDLAPSEGTLSPSFDKTISSYKLALPSDAESVTLKSTAEDAVKASITVNDTAVQSGTVSSAILLAAGETKTAQVKVTAENGTVKTYTVNITRALPDASGDNSLTNLASDIGAFNTAFNKDITVYSQNVGFNVVSMNLTPTASDTSATVTVNGDAVQGGTAFPVALRVGSNTITVNIIAQNGVVKTYTVIVTRYSNRLIDLGISSGSLSPQFDRNELLYTTAVENPVSSIRITPSLERPLSTVKVNDVVAQNMTASQDIALAVGANEISVIVTAEDGATKEYKIVVVRKTADPTADQDVELFKKLVDGFDTAAADSELISIKSTIENAVKLYEIFTNSQKTLAEAGNTGATSRKEKLYALYAKLMSAISYINTQATSTYYVEATTGFITNLDTQLQADDGQQLTIKLNVFPVANTSGTLNGKTVGDIYDLNITEQVTRLSDGSLLATNENVEPKAGQKITVKIKVPSSISKKKGLEIVYIDSKGNVVTQNASIVTENSNTYLVFEAEHFSQYAIVYTPDPVKTSSGSGSGGIVVSASYHESYINGYPDGTFQPENGITRAEAAAILSRVSGGYDSKLYYSANFPDLEQNGWYLNEVGYGSQNGLLTGYEDGNFRPDGQITRAEFAAIIARFLKLDVQVSGTTLSDISEHWAEGYIAALFAKGLVSGYEDGTFRPDAPITRAEAVKIINEAIGRTPSKTKVDGSIENYQVPFTDVDKSHWAYYDILEAAIRHKVSDFN